MIIASHHKKYNNIELSVKGYVLIRTQVYKYLGVKLDCNLSFKQHVEYIRGIIVNKIRTLLRLRNFLPAKTFLLLFKTTILPHMDYAVLVWGSAGVTVIDELQDIQTKTLERLLKLKGLDDAALHKKSKCTVS